MRPKVSVIIPTYNRAAVLREALDSVFAQEGAGSQFDLEVVVVDDASTDATGDVVRRFPGARHIHLSTNQGISRARNVGIQETTGPIVAFLDDDDVWLPRKLSRQVAALEDHPEAGVLYSQVIIASRGQEYVFPEFHGPSGSVFHRLLFVNLCMVGAVLVRREALNKVGGFVKEPLEDYAMWLRLARHFPFVFVPGVVAVYRPSPSGTLQTATRNGRYETVLRRIVEDALTTLPDTEASEKTKREARATVELRIADPLAANDQAALAWQHLRAAMEIDAGILLNPHNRASIAHVVGRHAAAARRPAVAVKHLWKEITERIGGRGARERRQIALLLAEVYWEVAIARSKGIGCAPSVRLAVDAAARSMLNTPYDIGKWRAALRFLARARVWRSPYIGQPE
jgi:GT2 family glycosyltransferase